MKEQWIANWRSLPTDVQMGLWLASTISCLIQLSTLVTIILGQGHGSKLLRVKFWRPEMAQTFDANKACGYRATVKQEQALPDVHWALRSAPISIAAMGVSLFGFWANCRAMSFGVSHAFMVCAWVALFGGNSLNALLVTLRSRAYWRIQEWVEAQR